MIGVIGKKSEGLRFKPVADIPSESSPLNPSPSYIRSGEEREDYWARSYEAGDYRALGRALAAMRREVGGDPVLYWVVDTMFLNPCRGRVIGSKEWRAAFGAQRESIWAAAFWLAGWLLPRIGGRIIRVPVEALKIEIDVDADDALVELALRHPSKRSFARAAGIKNYRKAARIWDRARVSRKPDR